MDVALAVGRAVGGVDPAPVDGLVLQLVEFGVVVLDGDFVDAEVGVDVEGSDCLCIRFEVVGDLAWGDHGEGVLRLVVGDREEGGRESGGCCQLCPVLQFQCD